MTEIELKPVRTPVSMQQYAQACRDAWVPELGGDAPYLSVATLWGQYMVETGGPDCYCWNIGNVKKQAGHPFMELKGNREYGKLVGRGASLFRAFPDLSTAMREHLRFLYAGAGGRYTKAWNCVIAGAPEDCARELRAAGYYTGRLEDYARGMRTHFDIFLRKIPVWSAADDDRIVTIRDLSDVVSGAKPHE